MNELVKTFEGRNVRIIDQNGELWFVLKDVCEILDIRNSRDAADRLEDDEKGVVQTDTLGGRQNTTIINESGLYNIVLRSDKPEAKPFRKWVTGEVLPSIRKTGGYTPIQFLSSDPAWDATKEALTLAMSILNLPESGKITMLKKAYKLHGINTTLLPDYSEEKSTKSATELLKQFKPELSAMKFNKLAVAAGALTVMSRTGSKGEVKHFYQISHEWQNYGKNLLNENNPKETQPHWYEDKFKELLVKVGAA